MLSSIKKKIKYALRPAGNINTAFEWALFLGAIGLVIYFIKEILTVGLIAFIIWLFFGTYEEKDNG